MPFDPYVRSTSDALAALGISPISSWDLVRYKEAQIRSHPPGLLYPLKVRYAVLGSLGGITLGSFFVFIVSAVAAALHTDVALVFMFGGAIAMVLGAVGIMLASTVTVRTPARWVDHDCFTVGAAERFGVPAPIMDLLCRVIDVYPTANIRVGLFVQNREVLDPYLLVKIGQGDWECLGIWEGQDVKDIATQE